MKKLLICCLLMICSIIAFTQTKAFYTESAEEKFELTEAGASHFANLALSCVQKEYPNKLNQVLSNEEMLQSPKELHPAFFGCFDWHSSVHGHWMLVKILKLFPDLPEANIIRQTLRENLTYEHIQTELAYFKQASKSWERMYGWAWLLQLSTELKTWDDSDAKKWLKNLNPLNELVVERYIGFLPTQHYPVRTGVHPNTAFGLSFAWDYAVIMDHAELKKLIKERAITYYGEDEKYPAKWEPSGEDFLSATLETATLMAKILNYREFNKWWKNYLTDKDLAYILQPADVSDRSDPKIVHLDGLNLSRAWNYYYLFPKIDCAKTSKKMRESANRHLKSTIPNVASTHYEGSHWLASFAVYALAMQ